VIFKRLLSVIVLISLVGIINPILAAFKPDSVYYYPFPSKFSTRVLIGLKELSISISNSSNLKSSNPKVVYKPNNGIIGGFGISYKNVLLSYYFNISGTDLDNRKYGSTSIDDYQINLTTRFIYISGFHRTYDGFYVSKPHDSYPDWKEGMPYPQRPDIMYSTKGIETIINLNPRKYSLNASLKLTEQQLKNVFSALILANYSTTSVSADSSLLPSYLSSSFFNGKKLYQSNFLGWTAMPGVSYSLVRNRWYFNPMFFLGVAYLHNELFFENDGSIKNNDYYLRINGRLSFGYNRKLFFAGGFLEWNEMFLPDKNMMIKTENFNVMIVFGYRF
jgi:hypothetical protein